MEQPRHSSQHRHNPHHHHHHPHHHHLVIDPSSLSSPLHHHHHHHHHHRHVIIQCALHNKFPQNPNSNFYPNNLITPLPQIPQFASSLTSHNNSNLESSSFQSPPTSHDTQNILDDGLNEFEEVDEEDPVFVMTDEWREFFAKSEARRREAKKLAKKLGKT